MRRFNKERGRVMAVKNQNWMLFGIDTLKLARIWKSSWMELLWGEDSPLRNRLDDKIRLISEERIEIYQSGKLANEGDADIGAVALPDSLFLERKLILPMMSSADLQSHTS